MFRSRFDAMGCDVNVLHREDFCCTRACGIAETSFSFLLPVTIDHAIMEQCRQGETNAADIVWQRQHVPMNPNMIPSSWPVSSLTG